MSLSYFFNHIFEQSVLIDFLKSCIYIAIMHISDLYLYNIYSTFIYQYALLFCRSSYTESFHWDNTFAWLNRTLVMMNTYIAIK